MNVYVIVKYGEGIRIGGDMKTTLSTLGILGSLGRAEAFLRVKWKWSDAPKIPAA